MFCGSGKRWWRTRTGIRAADMFTQELAFGGAGAGGVEGLIGFGVRRRRAVTLWS